MSAPSPLLPTTSSNAVGISSVVNVSSLNENHIYGIPNYLASLNPDMYQPRMVSIGPVSRGTKSDDSKASIREVFFTKSEARKNDYDVIFSGERLLYMSNAYTGWSLGRKNESKLDRVDQIDEKKKADIVTTMITDGSFILEILRKGPRTTSNAVVEKKGKRFYSNLTNHNDLPIIKQDMLLVQNQLPFWVLEALLAGTTPTGLQQIQRSNYKPGNQLESRAQLLALIIDFYALPVSTKDIELPYLHILDIYRRGLISQDFQKVQPRIQGYVHDETTQYFPSASKLYEAGIPFKKSLTGNLKDISFHNGTLQFPQFHITKYTAVTIANLIAFERLHGESCEVSSYIFFLSCLIRNAKDASLLESRGIIQHGLRDEEVVNLFGLIDNFVVGSPNNMLPELYMVSQQLTDRRFKKTLNIWRLDLLEKYFNTPWGALSAIVGVPIFILSIIQTVNTISNYFHPK